ncbi:unnamed protein product [Urochloa humidicola]
MATADAPDNPAAATYYSGPPLNPNVQPAVGEPANAPPQPQQNAGQQANHTQVVGIPGYYNNRLNNANTAASDRTSAAAPPSLPPPAPAPTSDQRHANATPPATFEAIEELSWIVQVQSP